ncbi:MAG: efflux RND transporter periplasmic adaptor subunit [Cycloclasticus sp.]|nr:efflux RND transporter periplasmic adaptor subunit [Cycloclasticus sp.]
MNKYPLTLLLLMSITLPVQTSFADEGHDEEEYEEISRINDNLAAQVEIVTAVASPGIINQTVTVYGKVTQAPEHLNVIQARFPGVIKSVNFSIGDIVKKGDRLITIESNESLKTYSVRAPISGTILQRQANPGELTQERQLLTIANLDTVWAEFRIYPEKQRKVSSGYSVMVLVNEQRIQSQVAHIVSAAYKPYMLARVKLDNTELKLAPGQFAKAKIYTGKFEVSLAVEKEAIQELGGRLGVFVKEDESYEFTPLNLGKSDDNLIEVISGIEKGSEYVSKNSYLIKADILKSEAEDND